MYNAAFGVIISSFTNQDSRVLHRGSTFGANVEEYVYYSCPSIYSKSK